MSDQHYALFDKVPDGFLDCPADRLASILPGPSLIDLPGRGQNPLFLSVLLHGNENSGLLAVQNALRRHADRLLPRGLLLFVGNVKAAAAHVRTLPEQADFNRVWPGTLTPDAPEAIMAQEVFDYVASRNPFASIDIHNNTGFNPHYSCITRLEPEFIALARLFSRIVVHFQRPAEYKRAHSRGSAPRSRSSAERPAAAAASSGPLSSSRRLSRWSTFQNTLQRLMMSSCCAHTPSSKLQRRRASPSTARLRISVFAAISTI